MDGNQRKRILILSTAYHPFVGGAEVAIKEIIERLQSDFEFDLVTAQFDKKLPKIEKIGSVTVYRVGTGAPRFDKILLPFRGVIKIWSLNNKHEYYCIWAVMVTFGSLAGFMFNISRSLFLKKKIPVVLTLQEGDSEQHLKYKWGGLIALSWKMTMRMSSDLTAISNFLLDRAKKNGWKKDGHLVPNGVDLEIFSKEISFEDKNETVQKLGKKEGDIFLVTTGRLTQKNGTDDVISALSKLPSHIHFIIIGKGDEGLRLQRQATELGVADRVKFLGFVPYEEIPKYFSVCDIFIRPSRSEGFGNSFIEAMAAKLPVIATPVGGIVDFIDDNETGIFCAPNNPQSIANAVNLILANPGIKEKIVTNAYNRVVARYSWNTVAQEMKSVFDTVIL